MARITIRDIQKMKDSNERITMLTAYDATSARLCEMAGVPMLLVGDTLGMVIQGHSTTIPVTLDQMIYHAAIVSRTTTQPLIVGDLPFMTYSINAEQALQNSARLIQEGGVSAVKLEGGEDLAPTIEKIVRAGIPVMAHIGLTPQSVNSFGGFHVQGRKVESAKQLVHDAHAVQEAGAFAVVLELVPTQLSKLITEQLTIPTIGIGAGVHTDGQVQVFHDILGLFSDFIPRHTKRYVELGDVIRQAIERYVQEVLDGSFPTEDHSFSMKEEVLAQVIPEVTQHASHSDS